MPGRFWGEAVYLLNRAPTKSPNKMTPYEAWYGKKPSARHMKTFGCMAYAKKVGPGVTKLEDRTVPGIFLGYEPYSKAYRVYDPVKQRLMISRDVIFDEKKSWTWGVSGTNTASDVQESEEAVFSWPENITVADPTIDGAADSDSGSLEAGAASDSARAAVVPGSPVPPTPSLGTSSSTGGTPGTSASGAPAQIQWATPPTGAKEDLEGVPLWYRPVPDLLESTVPF